jgi:hypothetical protein
MGVNANRLCSGEATRGDLGCPVYAPSLTTAGDISVTGNLSAARFIGDGAGLTGLSASNVSVTTGASGSLVFRDAFGRLQATSNLSISSTTGSVGIGAGAPASAGNYGLYAAGNVAAAGQISVNSGPVLMASGTSALVRSTGTGILDLIFSAGLGMPEALHIVSSGYVGIGTPSPIFPLDVSGSARIHSTNSGATLLTDAITFSDRNSDGQSFKILEPYTANPAGSLSFLNVVGNQVLMALTSDSRLIIGAGATPSATLHVSGTLEIANSGEACDANRLGAIKYTANEFYVCRNGSAWESLTSIGGGAGTGDRITSNSQAGIIANSTGTISLTTGGVTATAYFDRAGQLVNAGVSTTGPISTTVLRMADNPGEACTAATKGSIKVVDNKIFVCRYP